MRTQSTLLILTLVATTHFCPPASLASKTIPDLRSWDIQQMDHNRFIRKIGKLERSPMKFPLCRRGSTNTVAILQIDLDGTPSLNPDGYLYGPIPPLRDLTSIQAEQLWSPNPKAAPPSEGLRTFDFIAWGRHRFKIDFQFKDNRIQKFRVRSNRYGINNDWCEVN